MCYYALRGFLSEFSTLLRWFCPWPFRRRIISHCCQVPLDHACALFPEMCLSLDNVPGQCTHDEKNKWKTFYIISLFLGCVDEQLNNGLDVCVSLTRYMQHKVKPRFLYLWNPLAARSLSHSMSSGVQVAVRNTCVCPRSYAKKDEAGRNAGLGLYFWIRLLFISSFQKECVPWGSTGITICSHFIFVQSEDWGCGRLHGL